MNRDTWRELAVFGLLLALGVIGRWAQPTWNFTPLAAVTAFLVEPTPEGLAGGIRAALQDRDVGRARADRGYALIQREYSTKRHREKVGAAYSEVAHILESR